MRVIFDTNVLMSGIFFGGVPGRLLDASVEGHFRLVVSPRILEEYRRVGAELAARYPARAEALSPVLALVTMHATLVDALSCRNGSAGILMTTCSSQQRSPRRWPSWCREIRTCSTSRDGPILRCSPRVNSSTGTSQQPES